MYKEGVKSWAYLPIALLAWDLKKIISSGSSSGSYS